VAGTTYDANQPTWDRVLTVLNLRVCYQPAIREVIEQGRWRKIANPRAYVATAAYRRAMELELPFYADRVVDTNWLTGEEETRRFDVVPSSVPYAREPDYGQDEDGNPYTEEESWGCAGGDDFHWEDRIPDWLRPDGWTLRKQRHHAQDGDRILWERVAQVAVSKTYMARWVGKALRLQYEDFVPREIAIQRERRPDSKRAIAAAYKWIERNRERRIVPILESETEAIARGKLYRPPPKPPTRKEIYLKASAVLDALIEKHRARHYYCPNGGATGLVTDQVRYGW
jgi:hypothetical protein